MKVEEGGVEGAMEGAMMEVEDDASVGSDTTSNSNSSVDSDNTLRAHHREDE